MAQPQPCELDEGGSQSWIACFRHALFAIDRSALPGCRRQARIRSDLASIVEVSEKSFRPENGGELGSDALDGEQHGRRRRDRKSTRLNSSHMSISYAVFCLKKTEDQPDPSRRGRARLLQWLQRSRSCTS